MQEANDVLMRLQGQIAQAVVGQFPDADTTMYDDLCQEAYLGLLEGFTIGHTDSYYIQLAVSRARDYMRTERRRRQVENGPWP